MPTRSPYDRARMTVLTTSKTWRRPVASLPDRAPDMTDEERANVRAAIRFLRARLGGSAPLAVALKVPRSEVHKACSRRGRTSVGMALRAARVAKVPLEDVLSGEFPPVGSCPHCGRSG